MRAFRIPIFVLLLLLLFSLYANVSLSRRCDEWAAQLDDIQLLLDRQESPSGQLENLYASWQSQQGWLHILIHHDVLNDTEALLHRCITLASAGTLEELPPELAEMRVQFRLLAEMQHFSLKNVL